MRTALMFRLERLGRLPLTLLSGEFAQAEALLFRILTISEETVEPIAKSANPTETETWQPLSRCSSAGRCRFGCQVRQI